MAKISEIMEKAKKSGIDMSWLGQSGPAAGMPPMPQVAPTGQSVAALSPGAAQLMGSVAQHQAMNSPYMPFAAGTPTMAAKNAAESTRQYDEQFAYQQQQDAAANALRWAEHNRLSAGGGGGGGGGAPMPEPIKITDAEKILNQAKALVPETQGGAIGFPELPFEWQAYYRRKAEALLTGMPFNEPEPATPVIPTTEDDTQQGGGGLIGWLGRTFGGATLPQPGATPPLPTQSGTARPQAGGTAPAMPAGDTRPREKEISDLLGKLTNKTPAMPQSPARQTQPQPTTANKAEIQQLINQARANGYSDAEIANSLKQDYGITDAKEFGLRTSNL